MAVSATPVFPQTPNGGHVQILPADASALKTLYTAATNGSKVTAVIATSNDTTARDLTIGITRSSVFYPLGTITCAINAGQVAGTPALNLLDPSVIKGLPVDNDGQVYIFLVSGDTLQVKSLTTVTTAKEIDLSCVAADF